MQSKLASLFYENAVNYPNKRAIWCDGQEKTYKEMADFVSQYSNLLVECGVERGDHIAIPMNNSIESVALFFSAADIGACLVPLNPTLPIEAIKSAMRFGDIKHLIARRAFYNEIQKSGGLEIPGTCICLDGELDGVVPFSKVFEMSQQVIRNRLIFRKKINMTDQLPMLKHMISPKTTLF